MTRKKPTPQQQLRNEIDRRVSDLIPLVEAMIDDGVPVLVAFRFVLCWELEVMYYQLVTPIHKEN